VKKNLSLLLAFFLFSNINLLQSQTEYNPEIYGARAVQPEGQTQSDLQQFTKHFHPRFIFNLEYDDNVFLTPTDEQDDVLFILSPGILAIFPFDANSHVFTLDYHTDVAFFSEFDDQDFDNHYVPEVLC
jgi:hypothetical protein